MDSKFKRLLSFVLALVMVIGMFPVGHASAAATVEGTTISLSIGDSVTLDPVAGQQTPVVDDGAIATVSVSESITGYNYSKGDRVYGYDKISKDANARYMLISNPDQSKAVKNTGSESETSDGALKTGLPLVDSGSIDFNVLWAIEKASAENGYYVRSVNAQNEIQGYLNVTEHGSEILDTENEVTLYYNTTNSWNAWMVYTANSNDAAHPNCLNNIRSICAAGYVGANNTNPINNRGNNQWQLWAVNVTPVYETTVTIEAEAAGDTTVTIGETTYKVHVHDWADATCTAPKTCSICGATEGEALEAVAKIGETPYESLQAAINAVDAGEIDVLVDIELTDTLTIPAGKEVVLDLNGCTISQTKACTGNYQMILNDGNLTIKDSGTGGKISFTDSGNGGEYISNTITNRGTLTLVSGTVENMSSSTVASNGYPYAIDTSIWGAAAEVNTIIDGGKVYCASYSAMRLRADSETEPVNITISGGEVWGRIEVQNPSSNKATVGKLTVTGGTINKNYSSMAVMIFGAGGTGENLDVKITNGNFTGSIGYSSQLGPMTDFDENIISGGTFDTDVSAFVADGYELKDNGNGTFGVQGEVKVYVAYINGTGYETFAEAMTAASAMTGDVTVEICDKVTLNTSLSGSYDSIKFVGTDTDAEIYLDVQGYITATGKKVAFEKLILSKSQGGHITNAGFMNVAFGVYDVTEVTYTNCTFANGAYASSGKVTYNGCTFQKSWEKYGLWAYGDVDVTVNGGVFDNDRGIKMYAEGAAKTTDLTVKGADFSKLTGKPAIVLTYGESVMLQFCLQR